MAIDPLSNSEGDTLDNFRCIALEQMKLGHFREAITTYASIFERNLYDYERMAQEYIANFTQEKAGRGWRASDGVFPEGNEVSDVFQAIYSKNVWGNGSGGGSSPARACVYAGLVQSIINTGAIKRLIDLGCGDWQFSRYLNFSKVSYVGYDVVPSVIEANTRKFASPNIRFEVGDAQKVDLSSCDLVVCRDVLQHLSNATAGRVLENLRKAPLALVTNDFTIANRDCRNGDTRPVNITVPPFSIQARPILVLEQKVSFIIGSLPEPLVDASVRNC